MKIKNKYIILISFTIIVISLGIVINKNIRNANIDKFNVTISNNKFENIKNKAGQIKNTFEKNQEIKLQEKLQKEKLEIQKKKQQESEKNPNSKKVYLTFDDGPSDNTPLILQKLKKHNVKATFFVINKDNPNYQKYYKDIVEQGHEIAIHTYSHNYKQVYQSAEAYFQDYNLLKEKIKSLTGKDVSTFRLPGGSSNSIVDKENLESILKKAFSINAVHLDWNVDSEDAGGKKLSSQQIATNIINRTKNLKTAVILLHDTNDKYSTVDALDIIIPRLKELGYSFDTVENIIDPKPFQHRKLQ